MRDVNRKLLLDTDTLTQKTIYENGGLGVRTSKPLKRGLLLFVL